MQQTGSGHGAAASSCSGSSSSSSLAAFSRCFFLPSWPGEVLGGNEELMEETCIILLSHLLYLGSQKDWIIL